MAKKKTLHVCQECGQEFAKWHGRCSGCGAWNSLVEEVRGGDSSKGLSRSKSATRVSTSPDGGDAPVRISEVSNDGETRFETGIDELDRVLGGGFVPGGIVLLGGDPGIGKSTLSLQIASLFDAHGEQALYISGEESKSQLKMRADRLDLASEDLLVLAETCLEHIESQLEELEPGFLVIDSIQTIASESLSSSPGNVAQLREVTSRLAQMAKGYGIPTVLIGHVTKQGAIAGPKVLEHMVDTVLYFESGDGASYRVLRAVKNRYGSTNEIGLFDMQSRGLKEVTNPSALFLEERAEQASGSIIVPVVEGTRPILVELQALVSPNAYGPPNVTTVGIDRNRVILLMNIIEKRTGLNVAGQEVFAKVAGGIRLDEPAADLGLGLAIISSLLDEPIPSDIIVFGEVGLTGEVRAVSEPRLRLSEAQRLGFESAVLPEGNRATVLKDTEGDALGDFELDGQSSLARAAEAVFEDEFAF